MTSQDGGTLTSRRSTCRSGQRVKFLRKYSTMPRKKRYNTNKNLKAICVEDGGSVFNAVTLDIVYVYTR